MATLLVVSHKPETMEHHTSIFMIVCAKINSKAYTVDNTLLVSDIFIYNIAHDGHVLCWWDQLIVKVSVSGNEYLKIIRV